METRETLLAERARIDKKLKQLEREEYESEHKQRVNKANQIVEDLKAQYVGNFIHMKDYNGSSLYIFVANIRVSEVYDDNFKVYVIGNTFVHNKKEKRWHNEYSSSSKNMHYHTVVVNYNGTTVREYTALTPEEKAKLYTDYINEFKKMFE